MKNFWKQYRSFLAPIILGSVFSVVIFFGIIPIMRMNQEKMNLIERANIDRKMIEEQSSNIPKMQEDIEGIRDSSEQMKVFLSKDDIVGFVEKLESLGEELGVSVLSEATPRVVKKVAPKVITKEDGDVPKEESVTSVKKEEKKESLDTLLPENRSVFITFRVEGRYEAVMAFLGKLDTMPYMLDVLSVDFSPAVSKEETERNRTSFGVTDIPTESVDRSKNVLASLNTVLYVSP